MRVSVLEVKRLRRRSEDERGSFVDAMFEAVDFNCWKCEKVRSYTDGMKDCCGGF
jgi:hypothetical protein